jgi:transposase
METDLIPAELSSAKRSAHTSSHKSAPMSRVDLIPRGERRRRWTVEQKQTIAAESMALGASPTEVARQHGIGTGQLYNWRRALLAAQPRAVGRFVRVDVAPLATLAEAGMANAGSAAVVSAGTIAKPPVEIVLPDGTTVRVDAQIDPSALRRVLATLRG